MQSEYYGTPIAHIVPRIGRSATQLLKKHGVGKEQYALWLYKSAYNRLGAETALVILLCVSLLAALLATLLTNDGIALNGRGIAILLGAASLVSVTLSIAAWSMRHASALFAHIMTTEAFAHMLSAAFIAKLRPRTWQRIAACDPNMHRLQHDGYVEQKMPPLSLTAQQRLATLRPWQRVAGWCALTTLALLFFVSENGLTAVSAMTITAVGTWLLLRALRMYIAGQIVDTTHGFSAHGRPVRAVAVLYGFTSVSILLIGLAGLTATLIR